MSAPAGYAKLAVIGIAWKGEYAADTVYYKMNGVYYEGSTYVALKDNPTGPPVHDGTNWQYLAKGFMEFLMSVCTVTDTQGLVGEAGESTNAQDFMDVIANAVANQLLKKSDVVSQIVDDATKAASMAALYSVKQDLDSTISKLGTIYHAYLNEAVHVTPGNTYDVISLSLPAGVYVLEGSLIARGDLSFKGHLGTTRQNDNDNFSINTMIFATFETDTVVTLTLVASAESNIPPDGNYCNIMAIRLK